MFLFACLFLFLLVVLLILLATGAGAVGALTAAILHSRRAIGCRVQVRIRVKYTCACAGICMRACMCT